MGLGNPETSWHHSAWELANIVRTFGRKNGLDYAAAARGSCPEGYPMTTHEKLIKAKLNLLDLASYLGNVSEACRTLGYSRDTFF